MSGGVDSSVSAALLKQQGFSVTGVFIKIWQPDWIECTWREDREDAMRVAAKLDIPFKTLDLTETYKREVVEYMMREYSEGRTPNPDVMCNRHVKFGDFYQWAIAHGADYVATGHYANITQLEHKCILLPGRDSTKDQSYFLWTLTDQQLAHVMFPVGNIEKIEVRRLAHKFGLPNADKKDSQGLCFIGKVNVKDFIKQYTKVTPGKVLDTSGKIIGEHDGAILYTIGERHGFRISANDPNTEAYFVISKNIQTNTITVAHKDDLGNTPAHAKIVALEQVNLNSPTDQLEIFVRIRYRAPLIKARLIKNTLSYNLEFIDSADDVTVGQSAVFYLNIESIGMSCIGGGIIAAIIE